MAVYAIDRQLEYGRTYGEGPEGLIIRNPPSKDKNKTLQPTGYNERNFYDLTI